MNASIATVGVSEACHPEVLELVADVAYRLATKRFVSSEEVNWARNMAIYPECEKLLRFI